MREVERSAGSVEEAIEAALQELGASEQEVDVEIVQEPRSGFLGLGGQEATVRVRVRGGPDDLPSEEDLDEQADVAADPDHAYVVLEGRFCHRPRSCSERDRSSTTPRL